LEHSITAAKIKKTSVYDEMYARQSQGFTVEVDSRIKAGTDIVAQGACNRPGDNISIIVDFHDDRNKDWTLYQEESCDSLAKFKVVLPTDPKMPQGHYWLIASSDQTIKMITFEVTD
jgi:hypothetical protein